MTPEHRLLSVMSKEWDVLVLDLDGTLLCGQGEISHTNLHALDMVRELGTEVVVATGRSFSECKHILNWMNHHGVSITAGGSQLVSSTGALKQISRTLKEYIESQMNEGKYRK